MRSQRFVAGNANGGDYMFPGALINMRAKDREVFVESRNEYVFALESSSMTRGLVDPETTVDMLFSFRGSIQSLYVLATTTSFNLTYADVVALGDSIPSISRQYTYGGLTPTTTYYGWIAALGSLGETLLSRIGPIAGVSTLDVSSPVVASATVALSGIDIHMGWSVSDNKKVTDLWVLRTTDAGVKTNFDVIQNGVALSDTATTYTWTGGLDETNYFFWLVARDAAGNYATVRTTPSSLTAQLPDRTKALSKPINTYWSPGLTTGTLDISTFTLSFWVELNAIPTAAAGRIFSFEGSSPNFGLVVSATSGELLFIDSGGTSYNYGNFLTDAKWHHICYSRNFNSRVMAISIDGVVTSYTNTNLLSLPVNADLSRLSIGTLDNQLDRTTDLSIGEFYFSTSYHDLSIPSQLAKFWSSTGPVDLGLAGELPSGSTPYIYLSGDVLHNFGSGPEISEIKADGASTYTATSLGPWPNKSLGIVKQRNNYYKLNTSAGTLDCSKHTVSVWVKLLEIPTVFGRVLSFETSTYHFNMLLSATSGALTLQDSSANSQGLGTFLNNLAWHHVMFSRDYTSNTLKVCIDGVGSSYVIANTPTLPALVDLTKFNVGAFNNGSNRQVLFSVGEIYVSNRYLDVTSPDVIARFYNAGAPVSLGNNGSLPDGKAPFIYISGGPSTTNFGTGPDIYEARDAGALPFVSTPLP